MNSKNSAADQSAKRTSPFLRRAEQVLGPRAAEPEESFDALTDLFLGEVAASPSGKTHGTAAPTAEARPVLRLTSEIDADDESVAVAEHADETSEVAPAVDVSRVARPEPMRDAIVECIVLGNLPVLASAWASQYVREVSAAAGRPVAFIRVQGGFASVELVGEWAGGSGPVSSTMHERLEDALHAAACLTDRWILRVDSGQESTLLGSAMVRVVTVLTGIDEMARMAAFAAVKNLAPSLPKAQSPGGPLVRLAVMGAGDEQARSTGRVLAEAAEKIVHRPVQHVACSAKIRSTRSPVSLFSGPTDADSAAALTMIEKIVGLPSTPAPLPAPMATGPVEPATAEPVFAHVADNVETELATPVEAPTFSASVEIEAKAAPGRARDDVQQTVVMAPAAPPAPVTISIPAPVEPLRPAAAVEEVGSTLASSVSTSPAPLAPAAVASERPAEAIEPPTFAEIGALSAHIAGLRSVPLHCPYAPGVELALDARGGLHLLTRSSTSASDDAAIGTLMVAASWAESHAQLLVASGLPVAPGRAVLHLLTDEPKRTRRLLETNIRVHLLAPIALGGRTGWFCTELN